MSESIVSQKFTKIHLVKMVRSITGISLYDSVDITNRYLETETNMGTFDQVQKDLYSKMTTNYLQKEIEKEISNLEAELDRLRELRCCEQK